MNYFYYEEKIYKRILYKTLSLNLGLFNKEFRSIILQLIQNNLLHLSVALNISYGLLSAAELQHEITKQPSTYI